MIEGLSSPTSSQCLLLFVFVIIAVLMVWSVQMCFLFLFGVFPLKEARVDGWRGESWLESFLMRERSCKNPVFIYYIYQLLCSHNIIIVWNQVIFVFCVWLILCSLMFSTFIHSIARIRTSFLFLNSCFIVENTHKTHHFKDIIQHSEYIYIVG